MGSMPKGDKREPRPRPVPTRPRPVVLYLLLAIIFAIVVTYQVRRLEYSFPSWFGESDRAGWPFLVEAGDASAEFRIVFLQPNALNAGLRQGDTILQINGRTIWGSATFGEAISHAQVGDRVRVLVRSNNMTAEREVVLGTGRGGAPRFVSIIGAAVMPAFCLALGFWVAVIRARDPLAWLLLAFLLGFTTFFNPGVEFWGRWIRDVGAVYNAAMNSTWGIWLLLLGIYFPEPFAAGTTARAVWKWVIWLVVAPLAVWSAMNVIVAVGTLENLSTVISLRRVAALLRPLFATCSYAASLGTLVCLGWKWRTASAPDSRRRLRLVLAGAAVSFAPVLVLTVIARLKHGEVEELFPSWLYGSSYLLLFICPLTLAYSIVVQRAMDIAVVIRQGLQYTLARRGVLILQLLLSSGLFIAVATLVTSRAIGPISTIAVLSAGTWGIFLLRGVTQRLAAWIDRQFFRDAYDAEQILAELNEKVRTLVETHALLETVVLRIADSLHVPRIAVLLPAGESYQPAFAIGCGDAPNVVFAGTSATVQMLRKIEEPLRVYANDPDAWIYRLKEMTHEERQKLAVLRTELLLPMSVKGDLVGFISLGPKLSEEPYSSIDVRLLNSVATQTGLALQVARLTTAMAAEAAQRERLNRELEIAREVQQGLFPQELPGVARLDYHARCQPAREVGGDYYDFIQLADGTLGIAIGDISGKGIGAALLMANLQASLRAQAFSCRNLSELMVRINALVCDASTAERYATFFYSEYDPSTRKLTYVNAGHNPPLVLQKSDSGIDLKRLDRGGPVIGLLRDAQYEHSEFLLNQGDVVVLFTDGVSESMNCDEEEWGEPRLIECAKACYGLNSSEVVTRINSEAKAFAASAPQSDDMTLVALRIL
jgi:phosphoserine phosphatase RsbU/P